MKYLIIYESCLSLYHLNIIMESLDFDEQKALFEDVLRDAFAARDADPLQAAFSKSAFNDAEKKAAMDQAFRELLVQLLANKLDVLEDFVCFCIECCRRQIATATMPVILLGDMFDALTLDKCEEMFAYVENGVSIWKEDLFFMACKNNLLRMCNDLLRKLSRSQNTVFCGRILLFLAKFFPFSERSGLNIVSEFNLENVTEYGGENLGSLKEALEEESVVGDEKNKLPIDYNLYCKFWALQDFFRNPNGCYNKLQWKTFVAHSSSVLSAFGSYKLEAVQLHKSKLSRLKSLAMEVDQQDGKEQHYFAKFLTNQKLLELQLSDSNFRRCVLIQFLILFQYLNSTVKFKLESQELKTEQSDWVKETTALVYRLLGETPPDGKQFAECVRHILRREEHWNTWKNEGCPAFQKPKPPVQAESGEETKKTPRKKRRLLGDLVEDYDKQGKTYMGNNDLTKLWNLCPDNLAACRTKERDFMPSLEWYLQWGAEGADGRRRTSEGAWGWRALRLLARRSPHFFTHSNNPIGRLPDYLDDMVRRVARDAPSLAAADSEETASAVDDSNNIKPESQEEEVTEEQMEADLIKAIDDIEQAPDSTRPGEDDSEPVKSRSRVTMITPAQVNAVSEKLQADWKKLASKLGYKTDEIEFFESENPTDLGRATKMLTLWFDADEDASVENLLYIMEGLELVEACQVLRPEAEADK